jgi:hypothetical protein
MLDVMQIKFVNCSVSTIEDIPGTLRDKQSDDHVENEGVK